MRRTIATVAVTAMALAACSDLPQAPAPATSPSFSQAAGHGGGMIPDHYIVVLREGPAGVRTTAQQLVALHGGELGYVYEHALRGFSARLTQQAVSALERHPSVLYIEQDQVMTTTATQSNATWGLDRIDQASLPLNDTYVYDATGYGVNAYIIDTGIRLTHSEFTGRIIGGYDAITAGGDANDCNGHGTHVAGTVGGTVYGVAKQVKLSPIRVLDCRGSGTTSGVIAGVDWVRANHVKPAVANMSLGGGASTSLDNAVTNAINAGITFAVAAGNSNANACNYSPARVGPALTVGATTSTDARASYSNFGTCLDLLAPGSSITSAWYTNNTATNTISGTSMASPHVAGVAALYLHANQTASPATVSSAIVNGATPNKVTSPGSGSPNLLLYSRLGGTTQPTAPNAPSNLTALAAGSSQIDLTWTDNAGDESGFHIERCQGSNCTGFSRIATVGANTMSFANTGLSAGTLYRYRVQAYNGAGTSSYSNTADATTAAAASPPASGITLAASGYKVQGLQKVDLTWSGASGSNVDVYRDDVKIDTPLNSGSWTDNINVRGGGSYVYRVCNAGTDTCSPDVTVSF
jgi:hypothetical protein